MAKRFSINDADREQWIANDESLHTDHRRSRKSLRTYIRENRTAIDAIIRKHCGQTDS